MSWPEAVVYCVFYLAVAWVIVGLAKYFFGGG